MLFHTKVGIRGENLYVSHTLFILYLEGNHTLFGEKLYFIWKFSSGNTECDIVVGIVDMELNAWILFCYDLTSEYSLSKLSILTKMVWITFQKVIFDH